MLSVRKHPIPGFDSTCKHRWVRLADEDTRSRVEYHNPISVESVFISSTLSAVLRPSKEAITTTKNTRSLSLSWISTLCTINITTHDIVLVWWNTSIILPPGLTKPLSNMKSMAWWKTEVTQLPSLLPYQVINITSLAPRRWGSILNV